MESPKKKELSKEAYEYLYCCTGRGWELSEEAAKEILQHIKVPLIVMPILIAVVLLLIMAFMENIYFGLLCSSFALGITLAILNAVWEDYKEGRL